MTNLNPIIKESIRDAIQVEFFHLNSIQPLESIPISSLPRISRNRFSACKLKRHCRQQSPSEFHHWVFSACDTVCPVNQADGFRAFQRKKLNLDNFTHTKIFDRFVLI